MTPSDTPNFGVPGHFQPMVLVPVSADPDDCPPQWWRTCQEAIMSRTPLRLLLLAVVSALVAVVLPASAQAAPYCGISWGSLAKSADVPSRNLVLDVRAGRHACFDRLVVDLGG